MWQIWYDSGRMEYRFYMCDPKDTYTEFPTRRGKGYHITFVCYSKTPNL